VRGRDAKPLCGVTAAGSRTRFGRRSTGPEKAPDAVRIRTLLGNSGTRKRTARHDAEPRQTAFAALPPHRKTSTFRALSGMQDGLGRDHDRRGNDLGA
jgi:hypothetical protein